MSRVAESVYWAGRYLERAEATARLIKVHTELFLDLPRSAGVGWLPLLAVTGSAEPFSAQHDLDRGDAASDDVVGGNHAGEDEVVAFMASDPDNPSSIVASIALARANLRVTRALLPAASWEVLNQLHLWAIDSAEQAVDRRTRLAWTDSVIRQCQLLCGLLSGTMSHDETYAFLEAGRFLERADMTTRVLDVQAGILVGQMDDELRPYADVTWMSVLRSLSGQQMFLRTTRSGLSGPEALRFLLTDPQFPRSVEHCIIEVSRALLEVPRCDEPMSGCADVQRLLVDADVDALAEGGLHEYVELLQDGIADLHGLLVGTFFQLGLERTDAVLVTG